MGSNYLVACSTEVGGFPFRLAMAMRRQGHQVYYLSTDPKAQGHDSAAFHYGNQRPEWDLSGPRGRDATVLAHLRTLQRHYNFRGCLATGEFSYLLGQAGIPYHYWSYGADLDQAWISGKPEGLSGWIRFLARQAWIRLNIHPCLRRTVLGARACMIVQYQREALDRFRPNCPLFFYPHVLDFPSWQDIPQRRLESRQKLAQIYGSSTLLFSSARHYWVGEKCLRRENVSNNKGNDRILRSFAAIARRIPEQRPRLILVEKGPDIAASRELARQLGIEDHLAWIPEVSRSQLEDYYLGSRLCFGNFGGPVITYAALEPLAFGTPCISLLAVDPTVAYYAQLPPLFSSLHPEEVADYAETLLSDPDEEAWASQSAWRWVSQTCSESSFSKAMLRTFESGAP